MRDLSSLKAVSRTVDDAVTWLDDQEFGEEADSEEEEEEEEGEEAEEEASENAPQSLAKEEEEASKNEPQSLAEAMWDLDNPCADANC